MLEKIQVGRVYRCVAFHYAPPAVVKVLYPIDGESVWVKHLYKGVVVKAHRNTLQSLPAAELVNLQTNYDYLDILYDPLNLSEKLQKGCIVTCKAHPYPFQVLSVKNFNNEVNKRATFIRDLRIIS